MKKLFKAMFSLNKIDDRIILKFLGFKFKFKFKNNKNNILKSSPNLKLYNINGNNNKIFIMKENGVERLLDCNKEVYPGLFVEIYGNNNTIKIKEPFICNGTKILIGKSNIYNNDASLNFGKSMLFTNNIISVNFGRGQALDFKDNITMFNCSISLPENSKLIVGNDCMFSNSVSIRAADGHAVFDAQTGEILNKDKTTTKIGNHCWIGRGVTILKKANIPDNSIVAECSVVTKDFSKQNDSSNSGCVIAGVPASIKKKGINWARKSPTYFIENNINPLVDIKK